MGAAGRGQGPCREFQLRGLAALHGLGGWHREGLRPQHGEGAEGPTATATATEGGGVMHMVKQGNR